MDGKIVGMIDAEIRKLPPRGKNASGTGNMRAPRSNLVRCFLDTIHMSISVKP